ncbi:unnamed protein product [Amoebophrya sp. A120]|nr:unnamed protein product [Amoebophrya sp. A120]|eukprot:GSA120T00020597001.1
MELAREGAQQYLTHLDWMDGDKWSMIETDTHYHMDPPARDAALACAYTSNLLTFDFDKVLLDDAERKRHQWLHSRIRTSRRLEETKIQAGKDVLKTFWCLDSAQRQRYNAVLAGQQEPSYNEEAPLYRWLLQYEDSECRILTDPSFGNIEALANSEAGATSNSFHKLGQDLEAGLTWPPYYLLTGVGGGSTPSKENGNLIQLHNNNGEQASGSTSDSAKSGLESHLPTTLKVAVLGDHTTGALEETSLFEQLYWKEKDWTRKIEFSFFGSFCDGFQHWHCQLLCNLAPSSCDRDRASDLIASEILQKLYRNEKSDGHTKGGSREEQSYDLPMMLEWFQHILAKQFGFDNFSDLVDGLAASSTGSSTASTTSSRKEQGAALDFPDLWLCAHPVVPCLFLAQALLLINQKLPNPLEKKRLFLHFGAQLLYGAPGIANEHLQGLHLRLAGYNSNQALEWLIWSQDLLFENCNGFGNPKVLAAKSSEQVAQKFQHSWFAFAFDGHLRPWFSAVFKGAESLKGTILRKELFEEEWTTVKTVVDAHNETHVIKPEQEKNLQNATAGDILREYASLFRLPEVITPMALYIPRSRIWNANEALLARTAENKQKVLIARSRFSSLFNIVGNSYFQGVRSILERGLLLNEGDKAVESSTSSASSLQGAAASSSSSPSDSPAGGAHQSRTAAALDAPRIQVDHVGVNLDFYTFESITKDYALIIDSGTEMMGRALVEFYRIAVPLLVPTKRWMFQMHMEAPSGATVYGVNGIDPGPWFESGWQLMPEVEARSRKVAYDYFQHSAIYEQLPYLFRWDSIVQLCILVEELLGPRGVASDYKYLRDASRGMIAHYETWRGVNSVLLRDTLDQDWMGML